MNITIGGKPLRFSKYQQIYLNLLQQPVAQVVEADNGWIHLHQLDKQEAKKIYEAVRRRVKNNCVQERLQSSKVKSGDGYTLSLRRVVITQ